MEMHHHLERNLKRLRMPGMLYNLENRAQEAQENNLGYLEFLRLLLQDERYWISHSAPKSGHLRDGRHVHRILPRLT